MKKLLIVSLALVLFSTWTKAQKLEVNQEYFTGYLSTSNFDVSNTIMSIDGVLYMLYDDIPVALVRYPAMNPREEFEVPASVRRICNNAFQGTKFLKTLKIHNVVSEGYYVNLTIGENAFNDSSIENFVVIENDNFTSANSPAYESREKEEVARYNTNGQTVNKEEDGIQILVYSDNTTRKVLNKKK